MPFTAIAELINSPMKKPIKILLIIFAVIGFIAVSLVAFVFYHERTRGLESANKIVEHFVDIPALIKSSYGVYNAKHKGFRPYETEDESEPPYYLNICLNEDVSIRGVKHRLLAMCSTPISGVGDSHAAAGVIDFFVLRSEKQGLTVVAQSRGYESGSFGHPGTVKLIRLGHDFYGFVVEAGGTWQGETISQRTLLVASGDAVIVAAILPAEYDNGGSRTDDCAQQSQLCRELSQVEYSFSVDNSTPSAATYPLRIVANGIVNGKKFQKDWIIPFDVKLWHYTIPETLKKIQP